MAIQDHPLPAGRVSTTTTDPARVSIVTAPLGQDHLHHQESLENQGRDTVKGQQDSPLILETPDLLVPTLQTAVPTLDPAATSEPVDLDHQTTVREVPPPPPDSSNLKAGRLRRH